ncbi:uncharacterized protein BXIN_0480 [Babesia sp. Xinjiang]|uniref:uncharacterized protein n=1 Tax=Babesia sp. Xinjiang TaxID=462227 RepID=UPI000A264163|nr:uncharacterized protein BXIN_0480 [Babesia sp. Xinjiang]ORM41935.1 hypothetical protein BXIN_0480 [Babesia sp. Xinjiang]
MNVTGRRGIRQGVRGSLGRLFSNILLIAIIWFQNVRAIRSDKIATKNLLLSSTFRDQETAVGFVAPPTFTNNTRSISPLNAKRWTYTKVTLLKDTPNVGKQGEVAIVNKNYAFNYLVPFGFARYTTRAELVGIALDKDYKEALVNVRRASAMHLKARLGNDTVLHFKTPAQEAGSENLIAPLLPIHIISKMREQKLLLAVDMLREQDVKILTEGGVISTFGVHKVLLNVDPEVEIEITANVEEQPVDTSFIKDHGKYNTDERHVKMVAIRLNTPAFGLKVSYKMLLLQRLASESVSKWAWMGLDRGVCKRFSHHSAQRGKYYTNKFYMKKCSVCSSWNNLVVTQCVHCLTQLGDSDIRLRTVDPLCLTANARKQETESSTMDYVILHRCFDFTIMIQPHPSAAIHLSAVPNGTFYDIKNFRKTHIPMITKMKTRCDAILRHILTGNAGPDFLKNSVDVTHLRGLTQGENNVGTKSNVNDIISHAIYGFNYPHSFSHVGMHVILPPIKCFSIFKSPFFYPLSKVLSDLEHLSQVKPYTTDEATQLYENDIIMEDIVDIDTTFRSKYGL